ncbi:unnamed protein product, partial [Amoebophrya sp. A25]|eukprot:GSA25T00022931001.1
MSFAPYQVVGDGSQEQAQEHTFLEHDRISASRQRSKRGDASGLEDEEEQQRPTSTTRSASVFQDVTGGEGLFALPVGVKHYSLIQDEPEMLTGGAGDFTTCSKTSTSDPNGGKSSKRKSNSKKAAGVKIH